MNDDNDDYIQHPAILPHAGHNFSRYLLYYPIILAIHIYRQLRNYGIRGVYM